jgi:hypothetical protein
MGILYGMPGCSSNCIGGGKREGVKDCRKTKYYTTILLELRLNYFYPVRLQNKHGQIIRYL